MTRIDCDSEIQSAASFLVGQLEVAIMLQEHVTAIA